MNELYGIPAETIAALCKVNVRTARRWKKGERKMPEAARMIMAGDLGAFDRAWRGWSFRDGKLISPDGWEASPGDVMSITLCGPRLAPTRRKSVRLTRSRSNHYPAPFPPCLPRGNRYHA